MAQAPLGVTLSIPARTLATLRDAVPGVTWVASLASRRLWLLTPGQGAAALGRRGSGPRSDPDAALPSVECSAARRAARAPQVLAHLSAAKQQGSPKSKQRQQQRLSGAPPPLRPRRFGRVDMAGYDHALEQPRALDVAAAGRERVPHSGCPPVRHTTPFCLPPPRERNRGGFLAETAAGTSGEKGWEQARCGSGDDTTKRKERSGRAVGPDGRRGLGVQSEMTLTPQMGRPSGVRGETGSYPPPDLPFRASGRVGSHPPGV